MKNFEVNRENRVEEFKAALDRIKKDFIGDDCKSDKPMFILAGGKLAGATVAGIEMIETIKANNKSTKFVVIDLDIFRQYHPDFEEIKKYHKEDGAMLTNSFAFQIEDEMLKYVIENSINTINVTSLRNTGLIMKNIKESIKIIITSIILIIYLFLTGISASLERAVIFYILKNINKYLNLRYSNIQILFICAFIILFLNPFMIYDIGFIYSFIICFGIFYYSDFIKGNYVVKLFKLSLVTFLFSMPITIMVNYEVNLSSIFINMLFVPWISLIVYPLSLISFIIPILNPLFGFTINITNNMNILFSKISLIINIPKLSIILIILFYLVLLVRKKKLYICLFLILIFGKVIVLFDKNYYHNCQAK